ncbi:unnamed protein product [Ectocarpus sp. CCAP 1310/34]|nr:unnamed protein product [Ectocarpus sp. CCAP 1310/34]
MPSSPPADASDPKPIPLPRRWGVGEILTAKENRSVVKTLILFSAFMVAFPIGTFFAFHDYILRDTAPNTRTFCSGMAAVLAANIVMAGYAIVAIKEDGVEEGGNRPRTTPLKVD